MPMVLADDTEPETDVQVLRRRTVPHKDREAYRTARCRSSPTSPVFPEIFA